MILKQLNLLKICSSANICNSVQNLRDCFLIQFCYVNLFKVLVYVGLVNPH